MADDPFPSRSAIASNQLAQLRQLLRALVPANAFYSRKLAGFQVDSISSLEDFARLPFTTKTELVEDQLARPPFGTNLTFPLDRYSRYHQTSGTTGTPVRWVDTPESWDWMVARWLEILHAAGVNAADRVAFAFSFGPFIGFWLAFDAAAKLGALCLPAGGLSSQARLRLILDAQATVLCCTPTYALRLAEVAHEERLDLSRGAVRTIIVAGEPGGSIQATRSRLEASWPGARVFDHHGMTETGPVSFECPACPGHLHIMESGFIAEVLDPATGQSCAPGQTGELVLTNLGRTGSPLLRYRTGDLVKIAQSAPRVAIPKRNLKTGAETKGLSSSRPDPCACGRFDLLLEGGILGRIDDMVIVRGVNVYPSAVEDVLRSCGGVAEYQVKVNRAGALTELVLTVEPDGACSDPQALVARIHKSFQNAFALRIPVQAVPSGTLPRYEMKSKRWLTQDG
jgi:phenylacetate-CoA ligase